MGTSGQRPVGSAFADAGRRTLGLILIALVVIPVFRTLDQSDFMSGLMAASGAEHWRYTWAGFALVFAVSALLAAFSGDRVSRVWEATARTIARPPTRLFAAGVGVAGAVLTAWVAFGVLDGRTVLNDASVQLVQARYFAAGHLAGPPLALPEFWAIQFMVQTAAGWVSQYPPGHAALLAAGMRLGGAWITMAAATGAMGALLVVSFERLFPERIALARAAALLATGSPLLLGLSAGYMSHATLAAAAALALYLGLRAQSGSILWALAAGAAVGLMVMLRPVSGLLIGVTVTAAAWLGVERAEPGSTPLGRRLMAWVAGGIPFALGFGWFNNRFFGSPLTLGYVAASGPNHGLGFHEDPWGRTYTVADAVGNTSAELVALGRELLGAPVPIVAIVGVFLLFAPRLARGERLVLAWGTLPVLASALYWHHDLVFGPRMAGEAVPAWCALAALAAARLPVLAGGRWATETLRLVAVIVVAFAVGTGAYGRVSRLAARLGPYPSAGEPGPSLVFVHEPWADRLGGRLSGRGLRLDSVRALLGRYNPCQLEAALAGVTESEAIPRCQAEQRSDRLGGLGITGVLWLDDLPGLDSGGPMWVRDLGPERNAALIDRYPERDPRFLVPAETGGGWHVVPYPEGVAALWEEPPSAPTPPSTPEPVSPPGKEAPPGAR